MDQRFVEVQIDRFEFGIFLGELDLADWVWRFDGLAQLQGLYCLEEVLAGEGD